MAELLLAHTHNAKEAKQHVDRAVRAVNPSLAPFHSHAHACPIVADNPRGGARRRPRTQLALVSGLPGADALRCHLLSTLADACAVLGNRSREERCATQRC